VPAATFTDPNTRFQTEDQILFAFPLPLAQPGHHSRIRVVVPIVVVLLTLVVLGISILFWRRKKLGRPKPTAMAMTTILPLPPTPHPPVKVTDPPAATPLSATVPPVSYPPPISPEPREPEVTILTPPPPGLPSGPPAYVDDRVELEAAEADHPAFRLGSQTPHWTVDHGESVGGAVSTSIVPSRTSRTSDLLPSPLYVHPRDKSGFI
jgi:hypothetical protein